MDFSQRVDEITAERRNANKPVWGLIAEVKRDCTINEQQREAYLAQLYGSLSDQDVQERNANDALRYGVGTSFRASINDLRRTKKRMRRLGASLFPGANPKLRDREFAESLGVPVPKTFAAKVALQEIELVPNSILKPVSGAGASGVFFVDDSLCLYSMKTSHTYRSIESAMTEIQKYSNSGSSDQWILEEAILTGSGTPASDMKAYSFYGKSPLFLEFDRYGNTGDSVAAYLGTGEETQIGPKYKTFAGAGLPNEIREVSNKLSFAAPVPFLRLDFHYGEHGLYLGEITPHPGGTYSGDLYPEIDRMLGEHFADAKARLYIDLLRAKKFPEFRAAYSFD